MSTFVTTAVFRVQEALVAKAALVRPLRASEVRLLMTSVGLLAGVHRRVQNPRMQKQHRQRSAVHSSFQWNESACSALARLPHNAHQQREWESHLRSHERSNVFSQPSEAHGKPRGRGVCRLPDRREVGAVRSPGVYVSSTCLWMVLG